MALRDDDKLIRQLSLVAFLMSQGRPVTAEEIHEAVEGYGGMTQQAFLRRFYADRCEIEAMGLRLAVERPTDDPFQGDLYALPPENYYLPPIDFDDAEVSALQTCLYLLEGQFAYAEPLRLALQHLTLGRPSPLDDHTARTVAVNLLGGGYSPEVAAHLIKIEAAISRRKTIRFTYYTIGRDDRSEREVDPYSLLYWGGHWYVVGHSHEREAIRVFRLSRIEGDAVAVGPAGAVHRPEDVDLATIVAAYDAASPASVARIRVRSGRCLGLRKASLATSSAADGWDLVEVAFHDPARLADDVLPYGADAVVVEPQEAVDAVVGRLRRLAEAPAEAVT